MPREMTVRRPPFSMWYSAAAVVPPGEVTWLRSSATCLPDCMAYSTEPSIVWNTSCSAMRREKPRCTPASISASIIMKTYPGPEPLSAVAMSR
jgi:hypothetical protein